MSRTKKWPGVPDGKADENARVLMVGGLYQFDGGPEYNVPNLDVFMVVSGPCSCGASSTNVHQHYVSVIDGRSEHVKARMPPSGMFSLGSRHVAGSARCVLSRLISGPAA